MELRGAEAVVSSKIKDFIHNINIKESLYDENLQHVFLKEFTNWIDSSKLNNLRGLNLYNVHTITAGTIQSFDHWYIRHSSKRFRFFKGEFMYHKAVHKHKGNWEYLEFDDLRPNDAVVISVPFSDTGTQHLQLTSILNQCESLTIPVLLDFAYYPCSKNIDLDLSKYKCVESICFSLSKAFYGAEFFRIGVRFEKLNTDDGIDIFNSVGSINRLGVKIALELIRNFSVDYNWETYKNSYIKVCKELNLAQTDCIMFGIGGEEYKEYNRGGKTNRVCISKLIHKY